MAADLDRCSSLLSCLLSSETPDAPDSGPSAPAVVKPSPSYIMLPMELVCLVLDFVNPSDQETFAAACKVCRQWNLAARSYLYCDPKITSGNYVRFVSTICPSSTFLKTSPFGSLVRRLDLSRIAYESRPSITARLLRRTHHSLEEFIAPQISFGHICLVALEHCKRLRFLDLALVSHSVSLETLFTHIQDLQNLLVLHFPRCSVFDRSKSNFRWPPHIRKFSLAGGVGDSFFINTCVPPTLSELQISHCPFVKDTSVKYLLNRLSSQLTVLSVTYHIPYLPYNALDKVLVICPNLVQLTVAVDYVSSRIFNEENTPQGHPLRRLDLESSGTLGVAKKITPDDLFIAIAEERLSELRIVRVSARLQWPERSEGGVRDLVDLLESGAATKGETRAGVWIFDSGETPRREKFQGILRKP